VRAILQLVTVLTWNSLLALGAQAHAPAQTRNEVGLSLGVLLPPSPGAARTLVSAQNTNVGFGKGLTFEANYAREVLRREGWGLDVEVPLLAVPSEDVTARPAGVVPGNFASLFITPSLRARLWPEKRLSPWASLGGGYARYAESTSLGDRSPNPLPRGTNTGALQFGVGADYRLVTVVVPISLRAEVRDVYSGTPSLNIPQGTGHHDPFVTAGFVVHF
jgi:hypothetical protein